MGVCFESSEPGLGRLTIATAIVYKVSSSWGSGTLRQPKARRSGSYFQEWRQVYKRALVSIPGPRVAQGSQDFHISWFNTKVLV